MSVSRGFTAITAGLCLLAASAASAQSSLGADRGYVFGSFGFGPTGSTVTRSVAVPIYDETAIIGGEHEVDNGTLFEAGLAWALGKRFLVGGSYAITKGTDTADLSGSVPNPLYFDRARTVTGTTDALEHIERTIHIDAIFRVKPGARLEINAFGGPSIIFAKQQLASTLSVTETTPPYSTVSVDVGYADSTTTAFGFHVGGDATYRVSDRLGVTGFARYVIGNGSFPTVGDDVKIDLNVFQLGGGIRWFF